MNTLYNNVSGLCNHMYKYGAESTSIVIKNYGKLLPDNTGIRIQQGLNMRNISALASYIPAASIAFGVVATVGFIAYSAYQLYQAQSVPDKEEGVEEQVKILQEDMQQEHCQNHLSTVKQQISRHTALRDKYLEIDAGTSTTCWVKYTVVAMIGTSIIAAAINSPILGAAAAAVDVTFLLTGVVKKGIYRYLINSHDDSAKKLGAENSTLLLNDVTRNNQKRIEKKTANEINALKKQLADSENNNVQLQSQLADSENNNAQLQSQLADSENNNAQLQNDVRDQNQLIAKLKKEIDEMEEAAYHDCVDKLSNEVENGENNGIEDAEG